MAEIGYFPTAADADLYFATKRLETAFWTALSVTSAKNEKEAVLWQAYNRIKNSRRFVGLPAFAAASAAQLEKLQMAQAEMAYYLAEHLADEDTRKGLHAQGVVGANAVGETYDKANLSEIPFPPVVLDLLADWAADSDTPVHVVDIDRDENYSVDEDVTDLD